MNPAVDTVELPFRTRDGRQIAILRIAAPSSRGQRPTLLVLKDADARAWHEEVIQLLEGVSYDYELETTSGGSRLRPGVAKRSGLSTDVLERGRIEPGAYTGVLTLVLEDTSGRSLATASVEVRSTKLTYRQEYRRMLDDIADVAMDLLVDVSAPTGAWLKPLTSASPPSLVQRFFFIRHVVLGDEFRGAITRIVARPHELAHRETTRQSVRRHLRPSGRLAAQLASGQPRMPVPASHTLHGRLSSFPNQVSVATVSLTVDTPENRFVKFVLESFADLLGDISAALNRAPDNTYRHVITECNEIRDELVRMAGQSPFDAVDQPLRTLPLGSPVLQRRSGYREILRTWINFNLSTTLAWEGGDDLFVAGKRDVATLYEYWAFFQLLEVVTSVFTLEGGAARVLLEPIDLGLSLRLKAGRKLAFYGRWDGPAGALQMRFSYNRTFSRRSNPPGDTERSYPNGGSWTRPMRPDYTVSLWPNEMTEAAAEASNAILHMHFDAKYRIDRLAELFDEPVSDEADGIGAHMADERVTSETSSSGGAKRDDFLKMHAYRDAIRHSASAFILYPGAEDRKWREFEEIIPGLGAISLVPGNPRGRESIKTLLQAGIEVSLGHPPI